MATIDVAATITETDELLEEKQRIIDEIAENRTLLRGAVKNKKASPEQAKWIRDTFPEQQSKTAEERVKAAEEKLQDAKDKAAKASKNSKG